jgi:hypothetical protein
MRIHPGRDRAVGDWPLLSIWNRRQGQLTCSPTAAAAVYSGATTRFGGHRLMGCKRFRFF